MEKRRSPRSSKSPPGTAIFPKSPLVYEGYKSGCGWKLINLFDFRQVKSGNKRLSSEKKPMRDSAGNVYTKSQLDLLKRVHNKCQCNDRIVEGETSCKPKTRRRSFSSEREDESYEPKPTQGLLERDMKRIKNPSEATSLHECEKTDDKLKDCKKSSEINLQVCVNEAAETLISSKAEEKGKDRSKQFMEALDILSSNKELFITLLQDPNSISVKKGQDLERRPHVKERRDKSTSVADDLDEIVLLKPRLSSAVRLKHLAKKVKLVVGSNKESNAETKPEAFSVRNSDVSTSTVGYRCQESPVFRRKKRVESDVFKLSMEKDVLPRRLLVERQQERSNSSPVYEVPNELSSLQIKLKERRQKLEKRRELWSFEKDLEVFDPNPHNSNVRSLSDDCTSLERIHFEEETSEKKIESLSFDDLLEKDSVHEFVKKVLEASRLNWTNLMARCNEETSLLDEFSHGNHNNVQLLLVLDYADEILREINRQDIIEFWPFVRVVVREEELVQETLRRFDWSLLCCDTPRTLDQIIETDMIKPSCVWSGFGGETEGVVSDVVENILQRLVLDISHELKNNALQSVD